MRKAIAGLLMAAVLVAVPGTATARHRHVRHLARLAGTTVGTTWTVEVTTSRLRPGVVGHTGPTPAPDPSYEP